MALLEGYVDPIVESLKPGELRGVFVDSFELMGELPFTSDFLAAFEAQTGYDLTPHLPLLFRKGGESKYAEMIDLFGRSGAPLYRDPAPETSHAIAAAIREANRAKEEGKERVIVFNWSGHGLMDLAAYDAYFTGKLRDHALPDEELAESLEVLEGLPTPEA